MGCVKPFVGFFIVLTLVSAILMAQDGGWVWQNPWPQGNILLDVCVIGVDTVVAVGGVGTVIKTTNGGVSWNVQHYAGGNSASLRSVHFVDSNIGCAVGDYGTVIKTTDGGTNWTSQTSGTTRHLLGVDFVDDNKGWAVGDSGTILRSNNGGTNWILQTTGTTNL